MQVAGAGGGDRKAAGGRQGEQRAKGLPASPSHLTPPATAFRAVDSVPGKGGHLKFRVDLDSSKYYQSNRSLVHLLKIKLI